jgi:hypothetical protein
VLRTGTIRTSRARPRRQSGCLTGMG